MTKLPRMLVFAAVVLLIPHTASAQAWTFDFSADEIRLSSEGYRSAREIGERVRAEPGLWEADIELESVRDTASLDGRDVWRLRAVVLELTEQDVLLPHVDQAALVFAETTPPFGPAASPARIVVRIRRLQDDPLRLFHRHEPIVRFATGSTEVSPEGRFKLAYAVIGPGLATTHAWVSGYADTQGDNEANLELSQARADGVVGELIRLGLPAERIRTLAQGETQLAVPSADGVSEAGNRRATVRLAWPAAPAR